MRRAMIAAGVAFVAALAVTGPAHAGERVDTRTHLKVLPGHGAVFHDGDPIKLCYGTTTDEVVDAPVYIRIEMRDMREGAGWREVGTAKQQANNTRCIVATLHTDNVDIQLRAITLRGEQVDWSVSPRVRLDVA